MDNKKQQPTLSAEAIEARRAYKREWSAKNKDRIAEYQRRYWLKKSKEQQEGQGT